MRSVSFDRDWQFHLGDPPRGYWRRTEDVDWRHLDLPHDWSIELPRGPEEPSGVSGGFFPTGRGMYRKTFEAPEAWRDKVVLLLFEGVYMNAEVALNEHFLGRHPYGYTSFWVDLTPYLRPGEQNTLHVGVDNACQLNSRWYSGSGIYRHVRLYVADPVHVGRWGVYVTTPQVTPDEATVRVETTVQNERADGQEVTLRTRIVDPGGAVVGVAEGTAHIAGGVAHTYAQEIAVRAPQLWSPDAPALYAVESEVVVAGQVADTASTTFGIRTLEFSAERGFLLNGEPLLLKGGCVHHDDGVLGAASFDRAEERKVELLKASGYNAVRTAHNPPAPAFLDACDRLGMLVMDEAFDCWRTGKNPYDYHVAFDDWWERDIESMVLRDRNHPSVIMWSIGNEVLERDGRSGGEAIARALAGRVRALDPTRPVTCAICGIWDQRRTWEDADVVFAALDVGGYNYQWRVYASDHERHPDRIMVGTESFPKEALENWQQVEAHSYVIGDFVWTSLDYLGESGIGRQHYGDDQAFSLGEYPWHQAYCGDLDLCGFKRPQSTYRDVVWGVGDPLYLAVHYPVPEGKTPVVTLWGWPDVGPNWTWPGREGETFTVDVYSACERVELFLNGQSLGVQPTNPQTRLTATFQVAYQPGELKAVGYVGDQEVAECVLETVGPATGIRLTPDRNTIPAQPGSLSYVTVEVVDAQGRMQPNASHNVLFTVKGEGEIAAVGSGDPTNTEPYRGNQHTVYRGRCLAVVKSNGRPGEIHLRAHADGLEVAEVVITAA